MQDRSRADRGPESDRAGLKQSLTGRLCPLSIREARVQCFVDAIPRNGSWTRQMALSQSVERSRTERPIQVKATIAGCPRHADFGRAWTPEVPTRFEYTRRPTSRP